MKQNKVTSVSLKTLAIKARTFNQIRQDIYKKDLDTLTQEQKVELFDSWFRSARFSHNELNDYKSKRKEKAAIQAEREKRKAA